MYLDLDQQSDSTKLTYIDHEKLHHLMIMSCLYVVVDITDEV